MQITLENFIPLPLIGTSKPATDFWEKEQFSFDSNHHYLLVAPSGKGKTSLLSMIFGLRNDYRGNIFIDGKNARDLNLLQWSDLRKRKISSVFQGLELFDEISAIENIRLKNKITGIKSEKEIFQMAEALEMTDFLNRPVSKLSFGQKQRIAIIRALCQPFEFLLADEIFSHLDSKLENSAFSLIHEECRKNNAGLILTSLHNLEAYKFDYQFTF